MKFVCWYGVKICWCSSNQASHVLSALVKNCNNISDIAKTVLGLGAYFTKLIACHTTIDVCISGQVSWSYSVKTCRVDINPFSGNLVSASYIDDQFHSCKLNYDLSNTYSKYYHILPKCFIRENDLGIKFYSTSLELERVSTDAHVFQKLKIGSKIHPRQDMFLAFGKRKLTLQKTLAWVLDML